MAACKSRGFLASSYDMQPTLPRFLTPASFKAFLAAAAPFGLALLPLLRKRMGWRMFSLPFIVLFGGLWLLEKKTRKTSQKR
jgi:hypothetical protein